MSTVRAYGETPGEAAIKCVEEIGFSDFADDLADEDYTDEEVLKIAHEFEMIIQLGLKSYKAGERILDEEGTDSH